MKGFSLLKRSCPVCNGARKDCRQSQTTQLIHCRQSVANPTNEVGFKFVGEDVHGFGMWAESKIDEWDLSRRESWRRQKQQLERDRQKEFAYALPAAERDTAICKLHKYLGLGSKHRQNLRDRGLSDTQIDTGHFFTIYPNQELPPGISANLPGVIRGKLATNVGGFACPAFDVEGRIIGWQLRVDEATDNKYRWAKGWKSSHLPNGELPITICRPVDGVKRPSVGLAEGLLKPYVAAQKLGQIFIGAAGGNFCSSPAQLKTSLEALKPDIVTLYPDGGAVTNPHVMGQYQRTIELVSSWGYTVKVAWWGQIYKSHDHDIDELTGDEAIAYISPEEFLALGAQYSGYTPSIQTERPITRGQWEWEFGFGKRLRSRVAKLLAGSKKHLQAWGFGKGSERPSQTQTQKSTLHPTEYKADHRLDTWKEAAQEYKFVWDSSGTGTGKSFDAGRVTTAELLECDRIFYITSDPRNPTTDTLADWGLLDGRHQGLLTDAHSKLRRVKRGDEYTIQPNCYRVDTVGALREAGIEGADSSNLICTTCPYVEACRGGHLFGYLNNRMNALKLPRVRSHPASLPVARGEGAFDYSNSALIWEEWGIILKNSRQISVSQNDLDKLIVEVVAKAPEQFITKLQPILTALRRLITGEVKQPNRFGWNHHKLIEQLPADADIDLIDLDALASALKPDLEILDPTAEYGVSAAELPAGMRKKFTESDNTTADKVRTTLLKQWLMPFLRVLNGKPGYLTLTYGQLTITTPDERLVDIAHAAKHNIFLDATGHLDELALLLAILPTEICHLRQQPSPGAEVKRVQVAGMGRLGQHRGKEQQRRASAVVDELLKKHPNAGVIRFKRQACDGDYRWFVESRSVNDAQELDTLILDGIPCENLESMAAEFACLYGRAPIEGTLVVKTPVQLTNPLPEGIEPYFESSVSFDPAFAEFVRRRILGSITQAEGRLRASRRTGDQLTIYVLGDFALDTPVELIKASDITLAAASKTERVELAIRAAVEQLKATGERVTQEAIANLTRYTRGHISRFKKLIILLIEETISNAIAPDPPPEEVEWLGRKYLPLIADSPPGELLSLLDAYGQNGFARIWNCTPAETQVKILSRAFLTFRESHLVQLATAVGVT